MQSFSAHRRNVHLYLLAIFVLAVLTVALTTMTSHNPKPRDLHGEAPSPSTFVLT